ncbi:MAG: aminodeoxychorismate/anthranilate synthase component I, partial [Planctomycetota bacterium]
MLEATKRSQAQKLLEPLVRPLPDAYTPEYCFGRLGKLAGCVWLDSSLQHEDLGRYSYLAVEPFSKLRIDRPYNDALASIASFVAPYQREKVAGLPPFQGGLLGWFGYELGLCFEKIPSAKFNDFQLPVAYLGLYDTVLCWDHVQEKGWIISQGFPEVDPSARQRRAYRRIKRLTQLLATEPMESDSSHGGYQISSSQLAPQFATSREQWTSNFTSADYRSAVAKAVDYIHSGDVFQVNLS